MVGMDQGKFEHLAVARWPDGQFERPWRVASSEQVPALVDLLRRLAQGRSLTVALEPSGTYGDPLRQALSDAGIAVVRVSPTQGVPPLEIPLTPNVRRVCATFNRSGSSLVGFGLQHTSRMPGALSTSPRCAAQSGCAPWPKHSGLSI